MKIFLCKGSAEASTEISAFDGALRKSGVANYNLIVLSSVIPPNSEIIEGGSYITPPEEYGHKLYCVRADHRSSKKGMVIGAALGYYQLPDGRGVFVEHEDEGKDEIEVENRLKQACIDSVTDLCKGRGFPIKKGDIKHAICVAKVTDKPVCVLVIAVYQSEGWK